MFNQYSILCLIILSLLLISIIISLIYFKSDFKYHNLEKNKKYENNLEKNKKDENNLSKPLLII